MKIHIFILLFFLMYIQSAAANEAAKPVSDLVRECTLIPYKGTNEFITPQSIRGVYEKAKQHTDVLTRRPDGGLETRDEVPVDASGALREQLLQHGIEPGKLRITLYGVLFPEQLNHALQVERSWVAIIYVVQEDIILAVAGHYHFGGEIQCLDHDVAEALIETAGKAVYF